MFAFILDLEDIRHLLHTKLSSDEKISSSQLENHMNILDVLLRNRLEPVPEEKLNIVTSESMYMHCLYQVSTSL